MKIQIIMRLQVPGFHYWPGAPPQHGYLRIPHRHTFHITAIKDVQHSDRDVEFIELKHIILQELQAFYPPDRGRANVGCDFGMLSCEQLAMTLLEAYGLSSCEVSEDGENGALVTKEET